MEVNHDDITVLNSCIEYKGNKLRYILYEMVIEDKDGSKKKVYKAVRLLRVKRLPKESKQEIKFMDMHSELLAGVWERQVNFITIVSNILKPVALGLLFCYGVQAVSEDLETAKRIADEDFAAIQANLQGTYRTMEFDDLSADEAEWLRDKIAGMKHLSVVRGLPAPRKSAADAGTGFGGAALSPNSLETSEEFVSGMSDREYVVMMISTPVHPEALKKWLTICSKQNTKWQSQMQGSSGMALTLSTPMSFMGSLSSSEGWNHGYSDATNVGEAHSVSHSVTNSESFGESHGINAGHNVGSSEGVNHGDSTSEGLSVGESHGTNHGTSSNISAGQTHAEGTSVGTSESDSESHSKSKGVNESYTTSQSHTDSKGVSNGESSTASKSATGTHGTSQTEGNAYSYTKARSHSEGGSSNQGTSTSTNVGVSAGVSAGMGGGTSSSTGSSYSNGQTESAGNTHNKSASTTDSYSEGYSNAHGVTKTQTNSSSDGISTGVSKGVNTSYSDGLSHAIGKTSGASSTDSSSLSKSNGVSDGYSDGMSKGISLGKGTSDGYSKGISEGLSMGVSDGTSHSTSHGTSDSVGKTESFGQSHGTSSGFSGALGSGTGANFGVGIGLSLNKTYQFIDVEVRNLVEIYEFQNQRLMTALNGQGAFFCDMYIATPDNESRAAATSLAKAAWFNENALISPLQVVDLEGEEKDHLFYHFAAFSSCTAKEGVKGLIEGYRYSTVLLSDELTAYSHPIRLSEGGQYADLENIPIFAVPSMMKGELYLGKVVSGERWNKTYGYKTVFDYRLDGSTALHHAFITGESRSGKTVLAARLITELAIKTRRKGKRMRVIIMDPKQDWRLMAKFIDAERFRFYSLGDPEFLPIRMNLLKIPHNVRPQTYADGVIEIFCRSYQLGEKVKPILRDAIYEAYNNAGCFCKEWRTVATEASKQVTFPRIYQYIKKRCDDMKAMKASFSITEAYERLLDRLDMFAKDYTVEYMMFGVGGDEGIGVDDILGADDVVVLESYGLDNTFKSFVFGLITSAIYQYAYSHPGGFGAADQFSTCLIIEEANEVLIGAGGGSGQQSTVSGTSMFEKIVDQAAGLELFIFAITQKIADMPQSIIANAGLAFTGKISREEDIKVVMKKIGKDERIDDKSIVKFFPKTPIGWFVCKTGRNFDYKDSESVLVSVDMLDVDPPTNNELAHIMNMREIKLRNLGLK